MAFATALFAALQRPFWIIPYHHSFARGDTRYLKILFNHYKLPCYVGRIRISSEFPSGRNFGKAYIFPALGEVEVMDFGSLDAPLRYIP